MAVNYRFPAKLRATLEELPAKRERNAEIARMEERDKAHEKSREDERRRQEFMRRQQAEDGIRHRSVMETAHGRDAGTPMRRRVSVIEGGVGRAMGPGIASLLEREAFAPGHGYREPAAESRTMLPDSDPSDETDAAMREVTRLFDNAGLHQAPGTPNAEAVESSGDAHEATFHTQSDEDEASVLGMGPR